MERLEGLEGLESFGEFWRVCGLANGSFESLRKPLLWPGPGVPVGEVALALGSFAGWQTAALRPIESHCCGPGPLLRQL